MTQSSALPRAPARARAAPGVDMIELIDAQTRLIAHDQGMPESRLERIMPINRRI